MGASRGLSNVRCRHEENQQAGARRFGEKALAGAARLLTKMSQKHDSETQRQIGGPPGAFAALAEISLFDALASRRDSTPTTPPPTTKYKKTPAPKASGASVDFSPSDSAAEEDWLLG